MVTPRTLVAAGALLLAAALPLVAAHGDESEGMDMDMDAASPDSAAINNPPADPTAAAENYFRHPHYTGWMLAHIALMILAWAVTLPPTLMLSIARSRYHLPAQVLFHILNGLGVFTGFVYNHATPDLYRGNSHHPVGWVVTAFTIAWTLMSLFVAYGERKSRTAVPAHPAHPIGHHRRMRRYRDRFSRDSRTGSSSFSNIFGSRHSSWDDSFQRPEEPASPPSDEEQQPQQQQQQDQDQQQNQQADYEPDEEQEKRGFLGNNRVDRFLSRSVVRISSQKTSKAVRFVQIVLEKFLLLLGFLALTTGFVVWAGIFQKRQIFSGLAHFIKGGIFFWYGLLSLGRWMGAFSEFGWAWNVRPGHPLVARWKTRIPSAEFTESFVIWLYGASNVFLEHLNNRGGAWSAQDFEHVSITILFFGGGLCGMLIESSWIRDMLNTTVAQQKGRAHDEHQHHHHHAPPHDSLSSPLTSTAPPYFDPPASQPDHLWAQPSTYRTSLNPLPGLVIMLLGLMMSAHHQHSAVSTMMHAQWGMLFVGFALARATTYVLLFLRPPGSHFAARPPSELVAAFCLVAGGVMFMLSARDCVNAIEALGLDAMTVFTLTMGLAGAVMAWELLVFALKGWAVRKEMAAEGRPVLC